MEKQKIPIKDSRLEIRLSSEEKKILKEKAKEKGLTVTELILNATL